MFDDAQIIQATELTRTRISEMEIEVSALKIYPRKNEPYDWVALLMISKAFALSRAILVLMENGFPDEAFGLSRSLVECSFTMRFITADPEKRDERARGFLIYGKYEKAYWFEKILDPALKEEAEKFLREAGIDLAETDSKKADGRWARELGRSSLTYKAATCDHPLDGDTNTPQRREHHYAIHYHGPSAFVHCTEPSLANYMHETGVQFCVAQPSQQEDATARKCFLPLCVDLYCVVRYAMFGFQIPSVKLTELGPKFIEILNALENSR